ncbi:hypothetical protein [Lichenifustis flavocetrariae]|nr:hypothetical protein [Lichenifustis flavocetrariae]
MPNAATRFAAAAFGPRNADQEFIATLLVQPPERWWVEAPPGLL